MTRQNWRWQPSVVGASALAGFIGFITLGCTGIATSSTPQPLPVNNSSRQPGFEIEYPGEAAPVKPSPKVADARSLQKGMPYKEAHRLLLQQGWQANLGSTSEPLDLNDLAVKKLFTLGYQEIKACAGTGMGFCRFEWINQKQERLVVITAWGAENPTVHDWFIETDQDNPQQTAFASMDDRFKAQPFSNALFAQVQQLNKACGFYDITSPCASRTYTFRDAMLITTRNGTESTTTTLIPTQPMSQQQALAASRILDAGGEIDFATANRQSRKVIYGGCLYDPGKGEVPLCRAELTLTPDGQIARIVLTRESP